jgi:CheY-like chemotaxis protein/Tfp pilus assembly protein PilZ
VTAPERQSELPETGPEAELSPDQTVLVIDDVPYLLDVAALFLGRAANIETAVGGRAGLTAARRIRPDLVLCDDAMPDMNGLEVCRALRQDAELAGTPLIMLLSDPSAAAHGAAIRAGADDVVSKPLERLSLVSAVTRLLASSQLRGLPRVETATPVIVTTSRDEGPGTLRNLSRGGAFIETDVPLVCADEIGLRFQLPESPRTLQPSAEVVWRKHNYRATSRLNGAGLRFIDIDAKSTRVLDDFIHEHRTASEGAAR